MVREVRDKDTKRVYRIACILAEDYLSKKRSLQNIRKELQWYARILKPDMAFVFRKIKKDYGVDLKTGKCQSLTRKINGKTYKRADVALGHYTHSVVFTSKQKAEKMRDKIKEYENKNAVVIRRNNRYEIYVR